MTREKTGSNTVVFSINDKYVHFNYRQSRKKFPALAQRVVPHFVIIQRTRSTPYDYKICTLFLSRCFLAGEFELFTKPSKSDYLRVHQMLMDS